MSETVDNVTFVGGKAVEQHESIESDTPADELSAAKEAVRKAIAGAAQEAKEGTEKASKSDGFKPAGAKVERDPDTGKFVKGDEPKPKVEETEEDDEDLDLGKSPLKKLMKQREKVAAKHKEVQAANTELSRAKAEIAEQTRQIQDMWTQLQQREHNIRQEQERFARIRKDPASVARELGYDPEQFVLDLARDGTPEGQQARELRELKARLDDVARFKEDYASQQEQLRVQQEEHRARQYRGHIENQFISKAMDAEKYPTIAAFYKGRERALVAEGDLVAFEFRGLANGREATLEEILDYLEEDLADRGKSWYSNSSGTQKVSVPVTEKPKGSKGKTLTPEAASERRSLGKRALLDLDEDERREAAKAAVGAALAD